MGLPLVILPGLMCDSRMFGAQIGAFGAWVVDDFYGGADSIEAMAAYALMRMPERCALLGHSMDARVALEIWRAAPERVAAIALADTGVHPVRENEKEGRFALRDLGRSEGIAALADKWLGDMIGPRHRSNPDLFNHLRSMCVAAGQEIYEAQITALLERPECESLLATIDRPAVAIVGEEDRWAPVAQHEAIASKIPRGVLRVVGNAGHMAPIEEPAKFNSAVREWLALAA